MSHLNNTTHTQQTINLNMVIAKITEIH